jgi:hypothetical protein
MIPESAEFPRSIGVSDDARRGSGGGVTNRESVLFVSLAWIIHTSANKEASRRV